MTQVRVSRRVPLTPRIEQAIASLPMAFLLVDDVGDVVVIDGSDAVEAARGSEGPEFEIWIDRTADPESGKAATIDSFRSDPALAAARDRLIAGRHGLTHGDAITVGDCPHEVLVDLEHAVLQALELSTAIPDQSVTGSGGADLAGRSLAHFSVLRIRHRSPTTVALRLAGAELAVEISTCELGVQPWVVSVADADGVRSLPLIYETGVRAALRRFSETWA